MKKIISKLMGGVLLFSLSMSLTSCEGALDDILGEWSRPTPGGGSSSDETTPTMMATPLTLEVLTDGNITVTNPKGDMYYKKNGGDQVALTAGVDAIIDVTKDDKVEFYGTAASYFNNWSDYTTFGGGTAEVKVYGNIMSLLSPTGFADNEILTADNTFAYLFAGYTHLKDASNLFLPAETLTNYCYAFMFSGCSSLTTAPALPAETLTEGCYYQMFIGCTSLTTAPALPAESLANACYYAMFNGCSSLTTAPKLPATTLADYCYYNMFNGCTSLTTAPKLPATTLADYCYYEMFLGCTSLTTAPKLPATTLADNCYSHMFENCTNLTNAYVKAAYDSDECTDMFKGCTATGAKLHTTTANKASWSTAITSNSWSTWTAVDDWTD